MNRKSLIALAVVLALLLAVWIVQKAAHRRSLETPAQVVLATGLDAADMGRVEIAGPGAEPLVLDRSAGRWQVASSWSHPADARKIDELTAELAALRGEFRSDEAAVLADYLLDEEQAIRLSLFDRSGAESATLLLGAPLERGLGLFLRRQGETAVYASGSRLLSVLGIWGDSREPQSRGFLDLKVLDLQLEQVTGFTLEDGDARLDFQRLDGEEGAPAAWTLNGSSADAAVVEGALRALTGLRGKGVLDPDLDHGFLETGRRVELRLDDGSHRRLELGAADEEGQALRVEGELPVFQVYPNLAERVFKPAGEFRSE